MDSNLLCISIVYLLTVVRYFLPIFKLPLTYEKQLSTQVLNLSFFYGLSGIRQTITGLRPEPPFTFEITKPYTRMTKTVKRGEKNDKIYRI